MAKVTRSAGGLTPKRQRFVDEYLIDLNATRAYRSAGFRGSDAVCASEGHKLLRNPKVAAAIQVALAERAKRVQVDADWLLKRLADEAHADLKDIYAENGDLRPIAEWPLIWRQGLVVGIESVTEKVGEDADGNPQYAIVRKVKLASRGRQLELIGRHIGVQAFRDKVDVSVTEGRAARLAELRQRRQRAQDGQ
uniref:terminase small subunit n=1 Tax=Sphingomonas sp. AR_OL41 TaxID=3042729 RepID=UPI0024805BA5|nr:terminase small subunit [Sphingomonas sp. AR_OL41]